MHAEAGAPSRPSQVSVKGGELSYSLKVPMTEKHCRVDARRATTRVWHRPAAAVFIGFATAMLMVLAFEGARICSAEPRPSEKFQTLRKKLYDADRQIRLAAVLALRGSAEEAGIIEDLSGR